MRPTTVVILTSMLIGMLLCALFVSAARAAYVDTWSGAGPNACHGDCPLEWALTQLTDDERAELEALRASQPDPSFVSVQDGDVFSLMSYHKDGQPVAYRTTTVAMLPEPTSGRGWVMDGWTFVRLDDCQNWSIIRHGQRIPVLSAPPVYTPPPVIYTSFPPPWWDDPWDPPTYDDPWDPPTDPPCCVVPPGPPTPPEVVPLPAAFWMLLTALGGLFAWRRLA